MIETIVNFFKSILDFFDRIWELAQSTFELFSRVFRSIGMAVTYLFESLKQLPAELAVFAVLAVVVSVVYFILNRQLGGS